MEISKLNLMLEQGAFNISDESLGEEVPSPPEVRLQKMIKETISPLEANEKNIRELNSLLVNVKKLNGADELSSKLDTSISYIKEIYQKLASRLIDPLVQHANLNSKVKDVGAVISLFSKEELRSELDSDLIQKFKTIEDSAMKFPNLFINIFNNRELDQEAVRPRLTQASPQLAAQACIVATDKELLSQLLEQHPGLITSARLLHVANEKRNAEMMNFLFPKASEEEIEAQVIKSPETFISIFNTRGLDQETVRPRLIKASPQLAAQACVVGTNKELLSQLLEQHPGLITSERLLHLAYQKSNTEMMNFLLAKASDAEIEAQVIQPPDRFICIFNTRGLDQETVRPSLIQASPKLAAQACVVGTNKELLSQLLEQYPKLITSGCLLHVAFMKGNTGMINFLLEKGVSLDEVNEHANLPMYHTPENFRWNLPDSYFHSHSSDKRIRFFLSENYKSILRLENISVEDLAFLLENLDASWIEKNPNYYCKFVCESFNKIYPSRILMNPIEKNGLLKEPFLERLLRAAASSKRVEIFKYLLQKRPSDSPLSQTLISQIGKLNDAHLIQALLNYDSACGVEVKAIKPLVNLLNLAPPAPSSATISVAFEETLTLKNLAHLLGDSFVSNMTDDAGASLEGSLKADSLQFLFAGLHHVFDMLKQSVDPDLVRILKNTFEFAKKVEDVQQAKEPLELAPKIIELANEKMAEIEKLAEGQEIMMTIGFTGHAVVLVCKKMENNQLELKLLNTGDGLDYHTISSDFRAYANAVNTYSISIDELKDAKILQGILEIVCASPHFKTTPRQYKPADLYQLLVQYQIDQTNEEEFLRGVRKPQLAGTCGFRSLLLYLKTRFPPKEYKQFVSLFKEEAICCALEKYKEDIPQKAALRKFFSLALPLVFDNLTKRVSETDTVTSEQELRLKKLEKGMDLLEKMSVGLTSSHEALSLEHADETHTQKILEEVQGIPIAVEGDSILEDIQVTKSSLTFSALPSSFDSLATLQKTLQDAIEYSKSGSAESKTRISVTLSAIGRSLLNSQSALIQELKEQPEACKKIIEQLSELTQHIYVSRYSTIEPGRFLAIQFAFASATKLVGWLEEAEGYPVEGRISSYGVDARALRQTLGRGGPILLNAQWEEDLALLINSRWYSCSDGELGKSPLFAFSAQQIDDTHHYSLRGGDYAYVNAHSDLRDMEGADAERENLLNRASKANKQPVTIALPEEEWAVHWQYFNNQLPRHFLQLRELATLAHLTQLNQSKGHDTRDPTFFAPKQTDYFFGDTKDGVRVVRPTYLTISDQNRKSWEGKMISNIPTLKGLSEGCPRGSLGAEQLCLLVDEENLAVVCAEDNIAKELMQIRALNESAGPELTVPLLLDFFVKNPQFLKLAQHRAVFEFTLFSSRRLGRVIADKALLVQEVHQTLKQLEKFFEDSVIEGADKKLSVEAHAFLLNQHLRLLSYATQKNIKTIGAENIKEIREHLLTAIHDVMHVSDYQNPVVTEYLSLTLMDSCQATRIETIADARELLQAVVSLYNLRLTHPISTSLTPAFVASAQAVPHQQADALRIVFENNPKDVQSLLNELVAPYQALKEGEEWKGAFPLYSQQMASGDTLSFDCLTGEILRNGIPLSGLPESIRNQPIYRELFKDALLTCFVHQEGDKCRYHTQDDFGAIGLSFNRYNGLIIQREIAGQWCSYIGKAGSGKTPNLPPFKDSERLLVWASVATPREFVYTDPETMQTAFILYSDGTFKWEETGKRYEWVNMQKMRGAESIRTIDSNAFILKEVSEEGAGELRLCLPSIRNALGDAVEFVKQVPIGFDAGQERWVLKGRPHLYLSGEQQLPGIAGYQDFLVLETGSGDREALLPVKTFTQAKKHTHTVAPYYIVQVKDDLVGQNPSQNLYLAYLKLTQASSSAHYESALHHLIKAQKFESYSAEERALIEQIVLSKTETQDRSVYAHTCRVFAYWLIQDNAMRNAQSRPKNDAMEKAAIKSCRNYMGLRHHLPDSMHLEGILSERELGDFGLLASQGRAQGSVAAQSIPLSGSAQLTLHEAKELLKATKVQGSLPRDLTTRPVSLLGDFSFLLEEALSQDLSRRKVVVDALRAMRGDSDKAHRFLAVILEAALQDDEASQKIVRFVLDGLNEDTFKKMSAFAASLPKEIEVKSSTFPLPLPKAHASRTERKPERGAQNSPLTYSSNLSSPDLFNMLFAHFKEGPPSSREGEQSTSFSFSSDDPWIQKNIAHLNADYEKGKEKNDQVKNFMLQDQKLLQNVSTLHKEALGQQEALKNTMERLEEEMIALANRLPDDPNLAFQEKIAVASGRKPLLETNDLIALFLHGNGPEYQAKTHLSDEEVKTLHQLVGDYLTASLSHQRYQVITPILGKLQTDQSPELLNQLAQKIAVKRAYQDSPYRTTFMVFEHFLQLVLFDHQVKGIEMMMNSDQGVELQRIQGGGKSLVFGHIMALLKADGKHLSVHVPPTSHYQTSLYDMAKRSHSLFKQKERTVTFDDDPLRFTPDHLTLILNTMNEAIDNREYLNLTSETLRAMRCKYLKTRFLIQNGGADHLEESNQILKQILQLLRTKAVFTFDELHLALDPTKELNMPYGDPEQLDPSEASLMSEVLRYACLAKDDQGNPLLNPQTSRLQTPEQCEAMKQFIGQNLVANRPDWNHSDIFDFIMGKTNSLPSGLQAPQKASEAKLVTLARQLLFGGWLEERLKMNVLEDHGLPKEGSPRVSGPFSANMKPVVGSEFSDSAVIMTNTLLAYLVQGLNETQAQDFIAHCRETAGIQKKNLAQADPNVTLRTTPIAKTFVAAFDMDLFTGDQDAPEYISQIQKTLLEPRDECRELLLNYVIEKELPGVELYPHQTSSHGQNTVTMGKREVGYSGSMENPNIAPIGSAFIPEEGTNGQTIDRLISQKTELVSIKGDYADLFDSVAAKHPQSKKIRACIDVGAHFLGLNNEEAAQLICNKMHAINPEIMGVLFFHTDTGNFCFMHHSTAPHYEVLSGSTREVIAKETSLKPEQLFTYYDQEHITGTDIDQMHDAVALMTVKGDTEEHEILQGARRLRGLDGEQRIIMTVAEAEEEKIKNSLGTKEKLDIRRLILSGRIQEATSQKNKNLLFAMQKIENEVQQFVLDRLYKLPAQEEKVLFAKAAYLFDKNVIVDLVQEYGYPRRDMPIDSYLKQVVDQLLNPLEWMFPDEVKQCRERLAANILTNEVIQDIQSEITVSAKFGKYVPPVREANRESVKMQHKERQQEIDEESESNVTSVNQANRESVKTQHQERKQQQVKIAVQEQQNITQQLRQVQKLDGKLQVADYLPFEEAVILSSDFGKTTEPHVEEIEEFNWEAPQSKKSTEVAAVWSLNEVLHKFVGEGEFSDQLLITRNACVPAKGRVDVIGPNRKAACLILLICDATDQYKAVIVSPQDALGIQACLSKPQNQLPKGRRMWLLRQNGKPIDAKFNSDFEPNTEISKLVTEVLFFNGDYKTLSLAPWSDNLRTWWKDFSEEVKIKKLRFFEEKLAQTSSSEYRNSTARAILNGL